MSGRCRRIRWKGNEPDVFRLARGEVPDISNFPVEIEYEDGKAEVRRFFAPDVKGLKVFQTGSQTGVIEFDGMALGVPVEYESRKFNSLKLSKAGKTTYKVGDKFDLSGFSFKAHFSDGTSCEADQVLADDVKIKAGQTHVNVRRFHQRCSVKIDVLEDASGDKLAVGDCEPKVPFIEHEEQSVISDSDISILGVSVSTPPHKLKYLSNMLEPRLGGGVLELIGRDGHVRKIQMTDDMHAEFADTEVGQTQIIVSCFGHKALFGVSIVEPRVTMLKVLSNPTRLEYEEGDNIDLRGILLHATFNDGSTKEIRDISVQRVLEREEEIVVVGYMGSAFEVPVVVRKKAKEIYPLSVFLASPPSKLVYAEGEREFSCDGGVLMLQMSNGPREEIALSDAKISGFDTSSGGTKSIVVSYRNLTCSFDIEVREKRLIGVRATGDVKTEYFDGDVYQMLGLIVLADYDNDESIPVSGYSVDKSIARAGDVDIEVLYEGFKCHVPVNVSVKPIKKLSWAVEPSCKRYPVGSKEADLSQGLILVMFEDGTSSVVDATTCSAEPITFTEAGKSTINVVYFGNIIPVCVDVFEVKVLAITVGVAGKTEYLSGDMFDSSGFVIMAHFEDGSSADVSSDVRLATEQPLLAGVASVTLMYKGCSLEIDVIVSGEPIPGSFVTKSMLKSDVGEISFKFPYIDRPWVVVPFYPSTIGLRFDSEG